MPSEYLLNVLDPIRQVASLLGRCTSELTQRGIVHDASKFGEEEFAPYEEVYPRLQAATYGSEEYREALRSIKPAVQHHITTTRHHPEFFGEAGVAGMNLLDVLEMACDWIAASRRLDPNGRPDVAANVERFHIEPQLAQIFENTIAYLIAERNDSDG